MVTTDDFADKLEGFIKDVFQAAGEAYTEGWTPDIGEGSTIRAMILKVNDDEAEKLGFATMDGNVSDLIMSSRSMKNVFVNLIQSDLQSGEVDAVIMVDEAWESQYTDEEIKAATKDGDVELPDPKDAPNRTQVIIAAVYTANGGFVTWKMPIAEGKVLGPPAKRPATWNRGAMVPDAVKTAQPMH